MLDGCVTERDARPLLQALLAQTEADVCAAQRLRFQVFAHELGARLPDRLRALDRDRFDAYCDHLLVRDQVTRLVVGTYRILPPWRVEAAGGFYSESEFDLECLADMRARTVEVGRACVHPDYRHGGVLALLWTGLLRYVLGHGLEYVIGCASVPVSRGGHAAATVCRALLRDHLAPPCWRVAPRSAFVLEGFDEVAGVEAPPLLKAYLRLGAQVCGPPAWDPDFNTADLLMILPVARMNVRYVERFLRAS